jgi:hypothetical protein
VIWRLSVYEIRNNDGVISQIFQEKDKKPFCKCFASGDMKRQGVFNMSPSIVLEFCQSFKAELVKEPEPARIVSAVAAPLSSEVAELKLPLDSPLPLPETLIDTPTSSDKKPEEEKPKPSEPKPEPKKLEEKLENAASSSKAKKISLVGNDFVSEKGEKIKVGDTEVKIQYSEAKDDKRSLPIITPEILTLGKDASYAEFGGLEFHESNSAGSKKVFGDSSLFMAQFRGCVFKDVDFSAVDSTILSTVQFVNCKFDGVCKFPDEFVFKKISLAGDTQKNLPEALKGRVEEDPTTSPTQSLSGVQLSVERLRVPLK